MSTLPPPVTSIRVLVVDDHGDSARVLARLLRHEGHDVATAGSVAEALEVAGRLGTIDLIISDIGLPDGNGCDLLEQLRTEHGVGPPEGVVLSGHDEPHWLRAAARAGYEHFLVKPLVYEELLGAITRIFPRAGRVRPAIPVL